MVSEKICIVPSCLLLQAEHDIAVEKARQVTFMDRLRQSVTAGFGGGVIDVEEFGEDRAEKLNAEFNKPI